MTKLELPQANNWDQFWKLEKSGRFTKISWSKRRILDILQRFVGKDQFALDAGCGSGFFSNYFCDQGMITVSLDYSDKALDIARLQIGGRAKIMKKDLVRADLAREIQERFDIIFSDGLLEHFSAGHQDAIMRNLMALLNDRGVIITFVPNRRSPWELIRPFFMPGIEEMPFILKELIVLNMRNDLEVVEEGGINTIPFAWSPDRLLGKQFGMLLYTIAKKS